MARTKRPYEPKTRPTDVPVQEYLETVPHLRRRTEAGTVIEIMREVTGEEPVMWGPSMIGFGSAPFTNTLGTTDWFVIGLAPRAAALTLYGLWSDDDPAAVGLLDAIGKHTTGKGCVYIKNLNDIDLGELRRVIQTCWQRGGLGC